METNIPLWYRIPNGDFIKRHAFWGGSVSSLGASLPPLGHRRNWSPALVGFALMIARADELIHC